MRGPPRGVCPTGQSRTVAITGYSGVAGDLLLSTTGAEADRRFREMVDRVRDERSLPVAEGLFDPLEIGPGMFASVDFGGFAPMLQAIAAASDDADDDAAAMERLAGLRLTYGLRFDAEGLNIEFALPRSVPRPAAT